MYNFILEVDYNAGSLRLNGELKHTKLKTIKNKENIRAVAGQRSSPDLCFATTSDKIYDP